MAFTKKRGVESTDRAFLPANARLFILIILFVALIALAIAGGGGAGGGKELAFSRKSGFYDEPFELSIIGEGEIHYSLDGSTPTLESPLYTDGILISDRSSEPNTYADNPKISVDYFPYSRRKGFELPDKPVDKATVVRAAAFYPDGSVSEVRTAAYFVGFDEKPMYRGYGILSMVADPDDLFGYERGIYVIGERGEDYFRNRLLKDKEASAYLKAHPDTPLDGSVQICGIGMEEGTPFNYTQKGREWEREASLAFFGTWKELILERQVGIRIRGNNSRNFPQKSFGLFQRPVTGKAERFYYPYLEAKNKYSVALSGGADDMYTNVRDPFASRLFSHLNFGVMEFSSPFYLFLNGEFWGTYLMSEKQDEHYVSEHYNVDSGNLLIVKNGVLGAGREEDYDNIYGAWKWFLATHDLAEDDNYREFCAQVDMDSLLDYFATRIFADAGDDWPKTNVAIWRSVEVTERPYEDGKWRFLNYDNNGEFNYLAVDVNTIDKLLEQGEGDAEHIVRNAEEGILDDSVRFERFMFYRLMQNSNFRQSFFNRFVEILDTVYDSDEAIPILDSVAEEMRFPMVSSYSRWFGDRQSFQIFDEKVEEIRKFLRERKAYILPAVKEECGQD
ncbi:MAG: CotH kinase family protein [Lachnospiraceae bacterium]|nr:CotH kinase family protein [Lachnospiraceae bacterium]